MNLEKKNGEAGKGGVIPRSALYASVSKYTYEAIETLVYLMRKSRNDGIRLASARSLLDKTLPDLKAEKPKDEPQTIKIEFVKAKRLENALKLDSNVIQ